MADEFQPESLMVIDDLETLKVLSDPFRIRILEHMKDPTTAKAIAEKMDVTPNKLYYHLNLLEKHGIVVQVDTRVVSGIIEKWYQVAAYSITVAPDLLKLADDPRGTMMTLIDGIIGAARQDLYNAVEADQITESINRAEPERKKFMMFHQTLLLDDDERQAFIERFEALVEEFQPDEDAAGKRYGLLVSFYPKAED